MEKTVVLLSGGLDSTAALLWALARGGDVNALFTYYGQPAVEHECGRAIAVTRELGVQFHRSDLSGVFYGSSAGIFRPRPAGFEYGTDVAFVPGRNAMILTAAAARAMITWPEAAVDIVAGFNLDDSGGFPDCTRTFTAALANAINIGLGPRGSVTITTPWVDMPKREVIGWARAKAPQHFALIDQSYSCYRERGPCGECTACVVRAAAFETSPA